MDYTSLILIAIMVSIVAVFLIKYGITGVLDTIAGAALLVAGAALWVRLKRSVDKRYEDKKKEITPQDITPSKESKKAHRALKEELSNAPRNENELQNALEDLARKGRESAHRD